MSDTPRPTQTPNVVIGNPAVRRAANIILGSLAIFIPAAVVIDAATPEFDISPYTTPAMAGLLFLAGLFGVAVTTPNVPR
jgi:hypothetical protein